MQSKKTYHEVCDNCGLPVPFGRLDNGLCKKCQRAARRPRRTGKISKLDILTGIVVVGIGAAYVYALI